MDQFQKKRFFPDARRFLFLMKKPFFELETEDARKRFKAFNEVAVVCKLTVFFGSASWKVCSRVQRTNVFLSVDARFFQTFPSLHHPFDFHGETEILRIGWLTNKSQLLEVFFFSFLPTVSQERSGSTQVRTSLRSCCIRPTGVGRTSHTC